MNLWSLMAVLLVSTGPFVEMDDFVYHDDPCVEALRGAMELMEPFVPMHFKHEGQYWVEQMQLTQADMDERVMAGQVWIDAKLQCWRH